MSIDWEDSLAQTLDQIDGIINAAYFVPLSVGDALAIQFKAETLKGLPVETVAAVFDLMDRLEINPDSGQEPNPAEVAALFFKALSAEQPHVFELWCSADQNIYLDPASAFSIVLSKGEEAMEDWLTQGPEKIDPSRLEKVRDEGLAAIMDNFDTAVHNSDTKLRRHMRKQTLADYPVWARPGIYLDCWAEFVRAVADLGPRPETRVCWPY